MHTIWSRGFKENEFSKFDKQKTVVWTKGNKVMVISYEGYDQTTDELIFIVTDTRFREENTEKFTIKRDRLPGYFDLGNGSIDIDHVDLETQGNNVGSVLYYDWEEEPNFHN